MAIIRARNSIEYRGSYRFPISSDLVCLAYYRDANNFHSDFHALYRIQPQNRCAENFKTHIYWSTMGGDRINHLFFLAIEYLVRAFLGVIFPQYDWTAMNQLPFQYSVLLIVIMLLVWNIILFFWEKGKFKYSLEWFFAKLGKRNKPVGSSTPKI